MFSLAIITRNTEGIKALHSELLARGFRCSVTSDGNKSLAEFAQHTPDVVIIAATDGIGDLEDLAHSVKKQNQLPIIALVSQELLTSANNGYAPGKSWDVDIDDFMTEPWETIELIIRIQRAIRLTKHIASADIIKHGDLIINLAEWQVTLNDEAIPLTYKEYELLRFLASNPGKVFSREALLNRVWGYDFFGGDRTVDVHIRRLRSKIEDATHNFIETVRNIGYRFREDV